MWHTFILDAMLPLLLVGAWAQPIFATKLTVTFSQEVGVVQQKAVLRCKYWEHKETVNLVLWRRAKDFDAVFQYVKIGAIQHEGPVHAFRKRNVTGHLHNGYHELIIFSPKQLDEIDYICEIFTENSYGRGMGHLRLVEVPNKGPEVIYKDKAVQTTVTKKDTEQMMSTGAINVTQDTKWIILTCLAHKSLPSSTITWNITSPHASRRSNSILIKNTHDVERSIKIDVTGTQTIYAECIVISPKPKPERYMQNRIKIEIGLGLKQGPNTQKINGENKHDSAANPVVVAVCIVLSVLVLILLISVAVYKRRPRDTSGDVRAEKDSIHSSMGSMLNPEPV